MEGAGFLRPLLSNFKNTHTNQRSKNQVSSARSPGGPAGSLTLEMTRPQNQPRSGLLLLWVRVDSIGAGGLGDPSVVHVRWNRKRYIQRVAAYNRACPTTGSDRGFARPNLIRYAALPTALTMVRAITRCAGATGSMYSLPSQFFTCTTVVTVTTGCAPDSSTPL